MQPTVTFTCRSLSLVAVLASAFAGCSRTPAAGLRPDNPTFASATQANSCAIIEGRNEPFVVDWPADKRSDLEVGLSKKILVVSYDCKKLRLLSDCDVDGEYGFVGVTEKEQVLRLEDADEVRANLPFSGPAFSARLSGDFQRGTTLDIALAIIGKKRTARRSVAQSELRGECSGATHFVRGATLGAFAMTSGARAKVRSAAEIFGAGVAGASSSSRMSESRDGSLDACRRSAPSDETPISQCGAPVRLELKPIVAKTADVARDSSTDDESATTCPLGTMPVDNGKCATKGPAPHICELTQPDDCRLQCERGSMGSCAILGRSHQIGRGVPRDLAKAVALLERACKSDVAAACGRLGEILLANKQDADAVPLLQRSCASGWMESCSLLGQRSAQAMGRGPIDIFQVLKRSCTGGDPEGCWSLGAVFLEGLGVRQNDAEAARMFKTACDGGARLGCVSYAKVLEVGRGVPKDLSAAITVLAQSCDRGYADTCASLSAYYFRGNGVAKDAAGGISLLTRACDGGDRGTCVVLAARYENGIEVSQSTERARHYYERACEGSFLPACEKAKELAKTTK